MENSHRKVPADLCGTPRTSTTTSESPADRVCVRVIGSERLRENVAIAAAAAAVVRRQ